ncbi:hypothetical protein IFM89_015503 [Coptis chinensis]|uniref:Uncharacterized protein n=1 Tax=Coptis chinensis TaxID=261450 RepID=A0A835LIP6_9MAGN|nr:hypothetical protein IFM89_015503 [Coptis chinensis]
MIQSVDNEIVLWEPKTKEQSPGESSVDILQKYPVPECDIWFIKFSCDYHYKAAAIGNREGKIFVWELQSSPPALIARYKLFFSVVSFCSISPQFYCVWAVGFCVWELNTPSSITQLLHISGYRINTLNLQLGKLPCLLMEAPSLLAPRRDKSGDGMHVILKHDSP